MKQSRDLLFEALNISAQSLRETREQFGIANRAYIGLESFDELSSATPGETLLFFHGSIKNYGVQPAYFEIDFAKSEFDCVESNVNFIMPGQSIELHCERPIGSKEDPNENFCDILLRQGIHIRYSKGTFDKKFETILKLRIADAPKSEKLKEMLKFTIPEGCDGHGNRVNLQWYVDSMT